LPAVISVKMQAGDFPFVNFTFRAFPGTIELFFNKLWEVIPANEGNVLNVTKMAGIDICEFIGSVEMNNLFILR
jgi:hypothetical protein